jgi:hypothetical protein
MQKLIIIYKLLGNTELKKQSEWYSFYMSFLATLYLLSRLVMFVQIVMIFCSGAYESTSQVLSRLSGKTRKNVILQCKNR